MQRRIVIAVIGLSIFGIVTNDLRIGGYFASPIGRIIAYVVFGLNIILALLGDYVGHRGTWGIYIVVSLIVMIIVGAPTPLGGVAWLLRLL